MTTITIHENENLEKTDFLNLEELMLYLLEQHGYGTLHPLDKKEITPDRKQRIDTALKADKSKMLNL